MKEHSYWWDTVPAAGRETPSLPRRVDVAIVGGGYTGLAAAYQLARTGASVAVLERECVGWGASSRNGGQVLTGLRLDAATLVARYGEHRARDLFQMSLKAIEGLERLIAEEQIACDYRVAGHVQAASKPAHFRTFRDEQTLLARTFNHDVTVIERPDQHSELGSEAYYGLLVDERSAAINPARYAAGLADAARRAGAAIAEHVAVERIAPCTGGWTLTTSAGDLSARDVLAATNGYTDAAVPWLQTRLVPVGSYVVVTEPLDPEVAAALIPRRRMVFDTKHFLFYFRLLDDGRLLFGGRAEFSQPSVEATRRAADILRLGIASVFPRLSQVRLDYAWSGNVAFTRDEMPRAGQIEGMYYAGGYGGHGIAMATQLGMTVARRMGGERVEHPLFDDRFPPIPFYHGNPWFLPLIGAYYRVKDVLG